jgi:IclR family pca regulon transcriptional regulator
MTPPAKPEPLEPEAAKPSRVTRSNGTEIDLDFPKSEYVQSLERGLAVIRSFDESHPSRTLSEVALAVGLTRAAARRFVLTLTALGYLESDGKYYRLKPKTMELGYAYLASIPWWRYAQRVVDDVGRQTGRACAVGVLDDGDVAYLAYASGANTPHLVHSVGTRLPAYATAIGRALLAGLPDKELDAHLSTAHLAALTPFTVTDPEQIKSAIASIHDDGYAIVSQQLEIALYSIGVPIRDRRGVTHSAISLSLRDAAVREASLTTAYLPLLQKAAAEIAAALPA